MKKTISLLILFLCLILLFVHPMLTVSAAANGLMLWYQSILPALLPFAILSNILISSGVFYHISGILYPFIHLLIPCSRNACFPLLSGFLFGFPMGSRICAQMLEENQLSREEAVIVFDARGFAVVHCKLYCSRYTPAGRSFITDTWDPLSAAPDSMPHSLCFSV